MVNALGLRYVKWPHSQGRRDAVLNFLSHKVNSKTGTRSTSQPREVCEHPNDEHAVAYTSRLYHKVETYCFSQSLNKLDDSWIWKPKEVHIMVKVMRIVTSAMPFAVTEYCVSTSSNCKRSGRRVCDKRSTYFHLRTLVTDSAAFVEATENWKRREVKFW